VKKGNLYAKIETSACFAIYFGYVFFRCLEKIGERARECKGLPVGVERGRVTPLEAAVQPQLPCPSVSVKFGFYIN
jgi:hypothetical protein